MECRADTAGGAVCKGLSWSYDAWGNRTDQTVTSGSCGTFHATATTANQLSGSPYQYDAAGNMTHDASHSYTYDAENRVTLVDGGATASYLYDVNGQRVQKTAGSATTDYIRDLAGNVVVENYGTGWGPGYIYLGGQLVAEYANSTTYFVHEDHLGSTRLLTNMSGGVYDSMDYLPFGELLAGGSSTTHKFTGQERDAESGLDNFEARYDSSAMGRFMSPDPANAGASAIDPQSWNGYSYVMNNPTNFMDPTGMSCFECMHVDPIPPPSEDDGGNSFENSLGLLMWMAQSDPFTFGITFGPDGPLGSSFTFSVPYGYTLTPACPNGDCAPGTQQDWVEVDLNITFHVAGPTPYRPPHRGPIAASFANQGHACSSGLNAAGNVGGHSVTQTVTGCLGGCLSANGDRSIGTPSLGVTIDTSIDAPQQPGIGNMPPIQVGIGLGRFASVGTYFVPGQLNPQGFFYSAGLSVGFPISISIPTRQGNGCGG